MLLSNSLPRRRAAPIDRSGDRIVALWSVACSIAFLAAALASLLLPVEVRRGLWLPLHLVLAGSATVAIVGVMPFFVAAFAAAAPAGVRLRIASLAAVAVGALGVAAGVTTGPAWLPVAAGASFITGIALTGISIAIPVRSALGPSRGIVTWAYLAALAAVALGATLATLLLAGFAPVAGQWAQLKPAHAWLNLVGFVSLVIAATQLHLLPTVAGARILPSAAAKGTIAGVALAGFVVPAGFATGSGAITMVGAVALLIGALALGVTAVSVWRRRASWSSDHAWHRFALSGLLSAAAWFLVGSAIAAFRIVSFGATPEAWSLPAVGAPLVAGWVGLAIVASASHLLPSIGPGDPSSHARQRRILGRAADARLVLANVGIALLALVPATGGDLLAPAGVALTALAFGWTAALIAAAVAAGLRTSGGVGAPS